MSKEKCERTTDGWFNYCNAMEKFISQEANANKGLTQINVLNFKTGVERSLGVAYVKSKTEKLMLNVCPWCKERLDYWKEDK